MSLQSRINRAAQQALAVRPKGHRTFSTPDGVNFVETTRATFDYDNALTCIGGEIPEGAVVLTRSDLAALSAAGWMCIVVEYEDLAQSER